MNKEPGKGILGFGSVLIPKFLKKSQIDSQFPNIFIPNTAFSGVGRL